MKVPDPQEIVRKKWLNVHFSFFPLDASTVDPNNSAPPIIAIGTIHGFLLMRYSLFAIMLPFCKPITIPKEGPAQGIGISISCELSLDDGGEVSFIRKAGKATSSGKVTTEVAYDEYGYLIKYIFHVEWNTPITPTPYTIKLTVVADGVSFTQSKSIELLGCR